MLDCFGITYDPEEFANWQRLTAGEFAPLGSGHYGFKMPPAPMPLTVTAHPTFEANTLPVDPAVYAGQRVMELGCGGGGYAQECLLRGASEWVGIDISHHALACARELYGTYIQSHPTVTLRSRR